MNTSRKETNRRIDCTVTHLEIRKTDKGGAYVVLHHGNEELELGIPCVFKVAYLLLLWISARGYADEFDEWVTSHLDEATREVAADHQAHQAATVPPEGGES